MLRQKGSFGLYDENLRGVCPCFKIGDVSVISIDLRKIMKYESFTRETQFV